MEELLEGLRRYPVMLDFVLGAIRKLDRHSHKTSWASLPLEALRKKLDIEVQELGVALEHESAGEAMGETQDVANFAMFLYDRLRQGQKNDPMPAEEAWDAYARAISRDRGEGAAGLDRQDVPAVCHTAPRALSETRDGARHGPNLLRRALRDLSYVHRWGIYRFTRQQSTAEHSYFVVCYALQIARLIGWSHPVSVLDLLEEAVWHDAEEHITGDIIGPVKRNIVDKEKYDAFVKEIMGREFDRPEGSKSQKIKLIIKAADLMDELAFLSEEIQKGNRNADPVYNKVKGRLKAAWFRLPADQAILEKQWVSSIEAFIFEHLNRYSTIPENDSDVGQGR